MRIDRDRLLGDIESLGRLGVSPGGGVSRTSFSEADRAARRWLARRCGEAGLKLWTDGAGNMRARLEGPPGPALWTGSHLDSVPDGGRYDGALGVLCSLECLRRLREERADLARSVELVVFADEEGGYHQLYGSRAIVQGFDVATLQRAVGRDGDRLGDALGAVGTHVSAAADAAIDSGEVHAFVELHIEQGAVLESHGVDIGAVTAIVGIGSADLVFRGRADHAGTTPMDARHDALRGAAAFLAGLPDLAASVSEHAVVTCGRIFVEPGADNVVPAAAHLRVDFRDPDAARLARLETLLADRAQACAEQHGLEATFARDEVTAPALLSEQVIAVIEQAARACGHLSMRMPSGAAHDSQLMAQITATGMVFVPSVDGRSHCPAEHTKPEHIEAGANVLLDALQRLAT